MKEAFEKIIERLEEKMNHSFNQRYKAFAESIKIVNQVAEEYRCEDCAGCTLWKCDCANIKQQAITEFADFIHKKAKESGGLRLSSETRSWTHPCIYDYANEFREEQSNEHDK